MKRRTKLFAAVCVLLVASMLGSAALAAPRMQSTRSAYGTQCANGNACSSALPQMFQQFFGGNTAAANAGCAGSNAASRNNCASNASANCGNNCTQSGCYSCKNGNCGIAGCNSACGAGSCGTQGCGTQRAKGGACAGSTSRYNQPAARYGNFFRSYAAR